MSLNEFYNLKVNRGAKSARFVVNLKEERLLEEPTGEKIRKAEVIEQKLEKLSQVDYRKYLKVKSEKSRDLVMNFGKKLVPDFSLPVLLGNEPSGGKLDQLAFVALFKFIFIAAYKICYGLGWIVMFALRLVYFILAAILKPFSGIIYYFLGRLHGLFIKIWKDVPSGYMASQAVAMTVFSKTVKAVRAAKKKKSEKTIENFQPYEAYDKGIANYLNPVLVFAGVLLVIVLPVKALTYYKSLDRVRGQVMGASESALNDMVSAGKAAAGFDFSSAGKNFSAAGDNFLNASQRLDEINDLLFALAKAVPDRNIRLAADGKHILKAGELSAQAGQNLSAAMQSLFNYPAGDTGAILKNLSAYGNSAIGNLDELNDELAKIDSSALPDQYAEQFITLKQKAVLLHDGLKEFIGLAGELENFLGMSADKRYLLVFQNNSELRASGGFIGSFAVIDFSRGQIKNIQVPGGGSYDTDAGLLKKIQSPEPLTLVRPDWHFWDANWWPDWPASARKLAWFYENSDGSSVDGVISFTPTVVEKLLKVIGPIDMREKYGSTSLTTGGSAGLTTSGLVIDANNFWLETQKLAEQKPDVTKQPKKIIGDLMNKIIEELPKRLTKDNLIPILKAMEESLNDKNILIYFSDAEMQSKASDLGWTGEIKSPSGDYLNVVNTNIAGGKSDRRVSQLITHTAEVQADGSIIDTAVIKRTHNGVKREIFSGVRNVDWLRVYVPAGAELLSAEGFRPVDKIFFKSQDPSAQADPDVAAAESEATTDEASGVKIYQEFNKTVFAGWSQVDPGESTQITLKYRLPFKLADKRSAGQTALRDRIMETAGAIIDPEPFNYYSYSFLAQKQPGMNSSDITAELKLNGDFRTVWQYDAWPSGQNFNSDKMMAAVIEAK